MQVKTWFKGLLHDDRAATAVEYGLIIALLTLAIIGALDGLADETSEMYSGIDSTVSENLGNH
jgi:pilus assembly protein Flp/PilA